MLIDSGHRRWIVASVLMLVVATVVYVPYVRAALNGPSGGSLPGLVFGIVGFAFMIFAGLLGARRKVPTWRIGRGTAWMRGHIWLGLVSFPLILFHGGFHFGGTLTTVLMILFIIVYVSGIVGVILQQTLPRLMLTRVPLETVYEQIDSVVLQLLAESDGLVGAACDGVRRVADLFCGVGPFALRLAETVPVLAQDADAESISALRQAAASTPGLKPVTTETRDLFRHPLSPQELRAVDAVVFDPPRQGAEAQARALAMSRLRRILAISCDARTFARDAAILQEGGWQLASLTIVDQFRWTTHLEIAALFSR